MGILDQATAFYVHILATITIILVKYTSKT